MNNSICKQVPAFVISNTAADDKIGTYLRLGAEKYYVKVEKRRDNTEVDRILQLIKQQDEC